MLARLSAPTLAALCATAPAAPAQTTLYSLHGDGASDQLGEAVASAGDCNGDGVPDIVAGAPRDNSGGGLGYARVYSGADGSVLFTRHGWANQDQFGEAVAGAGDVNNDGFDDVVVGSRYSDVADATGNAQVFSGVDGSLLHTLSMNVDNNFVVGEVAGVGDLDGDGHDDVAVGAPYDDTYGINAGLVRVFSGATGAVLFEAHGDARDAMGWSVDVAGLVDGDAVPDLVVGSDGYTTTDLGAAWVISGVDGSVIHRFDGDQDLSLFGREVRGVEDLNGDGRGDVAVAAEIYDSNGYTGNGLVRVYSGLDGSPLFEVAGLGNNFRLGMAIDRAGDRDGDGVPDVLIGLRKDVGTPADTGAMRIVSGVDGAPLEQLISRIPGDQFGWDVASAGDVNGDGVTDFIGGAYSGDIGFGNTGSVYVMSLAGDFTRYCTALPNSTGQAAQIHADGAGSLAVDDLVLSVTGVPPGQFGLLVRGQSEIQTPLGNGFQSIGGAQRTFPGLVADENGEVVSPLHTGSWPFSFFFQVGATWKFQYWYRDAGAGPGQFNLSDAMSVTFLP